MEKTGTIPSGVLGQMDGAALYSIFNPTGNITALVENSQNQVPVPLQPEVAAEIMRRHPEVEQVGFVSFPKGDEVDGLSGIRMSNKGVRLPELRMAGGEFCGNASMCAAAYYTYSLRQAGLQEPSEVLLQVSGAALPVQVNLKRNGENKWAASIKLPPAKSIETVSLSWKGGRLEQQEQQEQLVQQEQQEQLVQQEQQEQLVQLPLVEMEGISHLIVEQDSPCFALKSNPERASASLKNWCAALQVSGLGLMFLENHGSGIDADLDKRHGAEVNFNQISSNEVDFTQISRNEVDLTPLVYIPGSDTLFWENSCASGSAAVGMMMAKRIGGKGVSLTMNEPGGILRVDARPDAGAQLFGNVELNEQLSF